MPRGFAALAPEVRREISRKGGRAAHARGTAHEFSTEEAREAGRKGGRATHRRLKRLKDGINGLTDAQLDAVEASTSDKEKS
jgi:general stress protein YciG